MPSKNSEPGGSADSPAGRSVEPAVERLADEVLWPLATAVDRRSSLLPDHFRALADLGLYGMVVPIEHGGLGLRPPEVRMVLRALGSGCGATAFAFAQHHGTTGAVLSSNNEVLRRRWLPALAGRSLAGIAYAHVRRPGPPILAAEPIGDGGDGWLLTGVAPFVTSWGTAEVFGVAASTDDGRMVWALVPGRRRPGMAVAKEFDLMVFNATQTVALRFDRYEVRPDMLLEVVDVDRWARRDRFLAARPNPLCIGIGDRALRLLEDTAPELAKELRPDWDRVTDRAEAQCRLVDDGAATLADVASARAETLLAVQRLTTALLAASGGGAIERDHPAQRLSREALFYVIQAQSGDGRAAVFEHLVADAQESDSQEHD